MTDELKPCPFCGGDATPDFSSIEGENAYHFHCQSKDCPAWPNVSGATESEAITAWNTRADNTLLTEARAIIGQAVQDVRYPPAPDSLQRRVERMERWLEAEKGTSHG